MRCVELLALNHLLLFLKEVVQSLLSCFTEKLVLDACTKEPIDDRLCRESLNHWMLVKLGWVCACSN